MAGERGKGNRAGAAAPGAVFGSGSFVALRDELREHDAFLGLSKSAQLILVDFIGEWNRADALDLKVRGGIRYSYGMCRVDVSKSTFKLAMLELKRHGFVRRSAQARNGEAMRYQASDRWRDFRALDLAGVVDFEDACKRIRAVRERRRAWAAQAQLELVFEGASQVQCVRKAG